MIDGFLVFNSTVAFVISTVVYQNYYIIYCESCTHLFILAVLMAQQLCSEKCIFFFIFK